MDYIDVSNCNDLNNMKIRNDSSMLMLQTVTSVNLLESITFQLMTIKNKHVQNQNAFYNKEGKK